MSRLESAIDSPITDLANSEDEFLQQLQVRKMQSYTAIANVILLCSCPLSYFAFGDAQSEILGVLFGGVAFTSILLRFCVGKWAHLNRHINPIIFAFSVLFLVPATISTALRPDEESGRAIVLVGLACSTYCFSQRWFVALQVVQAAASIVGWGFSQQAYGADEFLIFFIAVPAVGYIIFQSQLTSLKRANRLQREAAERQQELELAMLQLTVETELRHDEERRRRASEARLKEQHNQLVHVSRLTTMGELVAGIAHELHQPLHATSMYAGVLDALTESDDSAICGRLHEITGKIVNLTQQSSATVRRLQNFMRRGPRIRVAVDLREVIRDALELTATEIRQMGIQVHIHSPNNECLANVDPVQIQQVLVNLLRNASEAMHFTEAGQRAIHIKVWSSSDNIELVVSDTGTGIPVEQVGRVFDTFSSTKPDGLGMGLAISRTILEDHNGTIELLSDSQIGAAFRLLIPIQTAVAEASN